jgi:hypothetical protein
LSAQACADAGLFSLGLDSECFTHSFFSNHVYAEDPDNRGGSSSAGGGVHMRTAQGDVSPEDIFNMFFNGMAGGPGFHVYSSNGGMQFRGGRAQQARRQQHGNGGAAAQGQQHQPAWALLKQLIPILLFAFLSFLSQSSDGGETHHPMPGQDKYYSLVVSSSDLDAVMKLFVLGDGVY